MARIQGPCASTVSRNRYRICHKYLAEPRASARNRRWQSHKPQPEVEAAHLDEDGSADANYAVILQFRPDFRDRGDDAQVVSFRRGQAEVFVLRHLDALRIFIHGSFPLDSTRNIAPAECTKCSASSVLIVEAFSDQLPCSSRFQTVEAVGSSLGAANADRSIRCGTVCSNGFVTGSASKRGGLQAAQ